MKKSRKVRINNLKTYLSKPHNVILLIMGIVLTITTVAPMVATSTHKMFHASSLVFLFAMFIPAMAIAATSNKLEMPSYDEGFDKLYFVANDGRNMEISDWSE